jgi:hypothetical protein
MFPQSRTTIRLRVVLYCKVTRCVEQALYCRCDFQRSIAIAEISPVPRDDSQYEEKHESFGAFDESRRIMNSFLPRQPRHR